MLKPGSAAKRTESRAVISCVPEKVMTMTGIILAGGMSRRLRRRKATLELDGISLIEMVRRKIAVICDDIAVVSSEPIEGVDATVRIVSDVYPGCGPLGGIHAGLEHAAGTHAFVVACDMPFLSIPLLRYMARQASCGYDVVVPRVGEFIEPLHAVYSRTLRDRAEQLITAGRKEVRALFDGACIHEIDTATVSRLDPAGLAFFNLNTRADLTRARQLLRTVDHER